jgi:hypothetical protein
MLARDAPAAEQNHPASWHGRNIVFIHWLLDLGLARLDAF